MPLATRRDACRQLSLRLLAGAVLWVSYAPPLRADEAAMPIGVVVAPHALAAHMAACGALWSAVAPATAPTSAGGGDDPAAAAVGSARRAFALLDVATAQRDIGAAVAALRGRRDVSSLRLRAELMAAQIAAFADDQAAYATALAELARLHLFRNVDPRSTPPVIAAAIAAGKATLWSQGAATLRLAPAPEALRIDGQPLAPAPHIDVPRSVVAALHIEARYANVGWISVVAAADTIAAPLATAPHLQSWFAASVTAVWSADATGPAVFHRDGGALWRPGQACRHWPGEQIRTLPALGPVTAVVARASTAEPPAEPPAEPQPARRSWRSPWLWGSAIAAAVAGGVTAGIMATDAPPPRTGTLEIRW